MQKIKKELLILGTGRCGTMFIVNVLRRAGYKIGHERMGENGTCSLLFGVDTTEYPGDFHPGERRRDYQFTYVWHQVRDPLRTIGSLRDTFASHGKTRDWLHRYLGIPLIEDRTEWAMEYYYRCNMNYEKQSQLTYRVEDVERDWAEWQETLGVTKPYPQVNKTMHRSDRFSFKSKEQVDKIKAELESGKGYPTWKNLRGVNTQLAKLIEKMAVRYGYTVR